jgi:D-glycero-D-manno-heptose 1,7-bisphosphate phosphatase
MAPSAAEARPGRRFAVFLDRDGVINRRAPEGSYIGNVGEFELLPGVVQALSALQAAGATLLVVTNQRGVARGLIDPADLSAIHGALEESLGDAGVSLGGIYVCPHEKGTCDCRKPGVGLFLQAQAEHPWIDFGSSEMIGDSLGDVRAGQKLGLRNWLVGEERAAVLREAEESGVAIAGQSATLASLVAEPAFRAALGLS